MQLIIVSFQRELNNLSTLHLKKITLRSSEFTCNTEFLTIFYIYSHVIRVTKDGVWIGNWIYWSLEIRNYN
jgi:hypothetical protein